MSFFTKTKAPIEQPEQTAIDSALLPLLYCATGCGQRANPHSSHAIPTGVIGLPGVVARFHLCNACQAKRLAGLEAQKEARRQKQAEREAAQRIQQEAEHVS
ncbi:MAG TPA: hypothetical protein VFA10_14435 [Ktedonobacteraceae bacterium]|nr:hypothetical protein [Ktedonobacteraceae bacterium]